MPAEISDKKKLEANYLVYIKIAEREFLEKNFKSAIKNFKNVKANFDYYSTFRLMKLL